MPLATTRSTATTRAQLALETTPGTLVAASKRLPSLMIMGHPEADTIELRGQGYKSATAVALGRQWSAFTVEGEATFDELTYLLASVLMLPTPVTSDTTAHTWVFEPSQSNPDSAATYSVEVGDDTNGGWKAGFCVMDSLTLTFNRKEVKVAGTLLAQQWQTGATLALLSSLTELPKVPILPSNLDVFVDTTFAGIGTTRLTNDWSIELAISERWKPTWPLNSTNTSFGGIVESVPKISLKLTMEANAGSDAFQAAMANSATKFFRIAASSPILAGAATAHYAMTLDVPAQVNKPGAQSDQEGAWSQEWDLTPIFDHTAGYFIKQTLVNTISAL